MERKRWRENWRGRSAPGGRQPSEGEFTHFNNTEEMLDFTQIPSDNHGAAYARENRRGAAVPVPRYNANRPSQSENAKTGGPGRFGNNTRPNYRNGNRSEESDNRRTNRQGENNSGHRERRERYYKVGFRKLEEFIREDPDSLILKLSNEKTGFSNLLDEQLSNDYVVLIIKLIAKMCLSAFDSNKSSLMYMACRENFLSQLNFFILNLPIQSPEERKKSSYYWNDVETFWRNMHICCETIINTIPSVACDVLQKLLKAVLYTVPNLRVSDKVHSNFEEIQLKLIMHKEEMERKERKGVNEAMDLEPTDDFRNMTLYPTAAEITTLEQAFLRENIVKGSYKNVEHYLDVQFRLLREDFVSPLRNGVRDFFANGDFRKKLQNIKIHRKVQFLRPELVNGSRGVLLQFNFSEKKQKFKHENSRKFMFGSLVCFTKNTFATLLFGKILDRRKELLEKGMLIIGFEPGMDNFELKVDYLMVECNVYFEPYYHVLSALQKMNDANFPMKEYLVDVTRHVEFPGYYVNSTHLEIHGHAVDVYLGNWPSMVTLELNASQYKAYITALTQKFAIIQGPPGTGKTYLGLRIAKTLIKNSTLWNKFTPMLVICYTNHALDQFLEGLIGTTDKILRIGGQSKNETLKEFNIREVRSKTRRRGDINHLFWQKRNEVERLARDLKATYTNLDEIYNYNGIIDVSSIAHLEAELKGSWFDRATGENFKTWLMGGRTREERDREKLVIAVEQAQQVTWAEENDGSGDESDGDEMFDGVNREENVIDIDDHFGNLPAMHSVKYAVKVDDIRRNINVLHGQLEAANAENRGDNVIFDKRLRIREDINQLENDLDYLTTCLNQGKTRTFDSKPRNVDLQSPQNMQPRDRWHLYFYLLELFKTALTKGLEKKEASYRLVHREYEEIRSIEDTQIMRSCLVVGMTTTSAARLQTTLQALKCPIVIVEEAAEILESHIIASLTNHCQHLILIGDHQQLRPSTADYKIEKKYLLGISLFERMVKNKVHCNLLDVQHRMRPEIASLIVPSIYSKLENHQSVYDFPSVKGVDTCLYFVTHDNQEEVSGDNSKSNTHEAKFLLQLAKYLILNGYEPEDVTILAAYSGQMFTLWKERKRVEILKDVRITVLDNYQGEESKIILLSLVRNNNENQIGFLSIENRVCVALSRAREGFYMMGNINLLAANSQIWPKVRETLVSQDALGTTLPLRCQIHLDMLTRVQNAQDFFKVSEGGCSRLCGQVLNCGHTCAMQCHVRNRDHSEYKCKEKCKRSICDRNHPCPKMCWKLCGICNFLVPRILSCGHVQNIPCHMKPKQHLCQAIVTVELPCKHKADKPCHSDTESYPCPYPCEARIDSCGHSCRLRCHVKKDPDHLEYKCHKPCAKYRVGCTVMDEKHICPKVCSDECAPCTLIIKKKRTVCPHVYDVECRANADEVECNKPCRKVLPCGHFCKLKCREACGNCAVMVDKILSDCNHKVKVKCCEEPTRAMCRGKCPRLLPCRHPCTLTCRETCTTQCKVLVDSPFNAGCGHHFQIPCYMRYEQFTENDDKLLQYCRVPCGKILECKHTCSGTCGECNQGRIHKTCGEDCGSILVCGHKCMIPCRQTCQPCTQPCTYRCRHSKCTKKCGEPCTPCKEFCPRRCEHIKCPKKCGDKCTVPPCDEPCMKRLKCGHPCIGFCGDPCPPLCVICNEKELTDDFVLGYEEEEGARFVLLEECGHVIESRGLQMWLESGGDQVNVKRCPKCNTPLAFTKRFSDYIKESVENVTKVKKMYYGTYEENERLRKDLLAKLHSIYNETRLKSASVQCGNVYVKLQESLLPVRTGRRQKLHNLLAKTFTSKIQIYQQICELYNTSKVSERSTKCIKYINFLLRTLTVQEDRITNQEIDDFECEIKRFRRMLQLCEIEECTGVARNTSNQRIVELYRTLTHKLYSLNKYKVEDDDKIKNRLIELAQKSSYGGLDVSKEELQQIVKAVGVAVGAWYKCPNGHPYAIGECGRAMQVSKCIECGAQIGGSGHSLLRGNTHARDIDNSRHAAWFEAANMANYDLNRLRFD